MSGNPSLDWATMAVSVFNTILLLWLGMTVLLNAERRTPGIWIAGLMLLTGSIFFLSHTIILASGLNEVSQSLNFWWHLGWFPVVILPYAWYGVMLWYTGMWSEIDSPLHQRHLPWLYLMSGLAALVIGMLFFANPLPSFFQIIHLDITATPSLFGAPLLILVYPVYTLLCLGLSLDVLRHPAPPRRLMGDLARQRARPWLTAATGVQILVSLLVGWVMWWVVNQTRLPTYTSEMAATIARFDLAISALIAAAGLLLGQAIISYEAFTGKSLPRRGLTRYWRGLVLLAAGYALLASWSLARGLPEVYIMLLSGALITAIYALSSWRSFAERESYLAQLRPFVASQELYEQLLTPSSNAAADLQADQAFNALCQDVLAAQQAALVPWGALALLAGPSLVYPPGQNLPFPPAGEALAKVDNPHTLCIALEPPGEQLEGWAIPLWSPRGLIGVLFLGAKQDGGLYAQEEIEIARTVCERLLDLKASSEMARRLMALQRQRLAENQILDQRTRRTLHDEVLPQIHAILLSLDAAHDTGNREALAALEDLHRLVSDLLRQLPASTAPEVARMGLVRALQQAVQVDYKDAFDQVTWEISAAAESSIRALPPLSVEVLYYACREAIRNAARHARGEASASPLHLLIGADCQDGLEIYIEDNGVGMNREEVSASGGGQGLALHGTLMAVLGGALVVESTPNTSTRVTLTLPA